jgi:hypothetical protein
MVNFTFQPLFPWWKPPGYPLKRMLVYPKADMNIWEKRKIFLPCHESKYLPSVVHPAILLLTDLSRLPILRVDSLKISNSGREVVLNLVMRRNPKKLKYHKFFSTLSITYHPNFGA